MNFKEKVYQALMSSPELKALLVKDRKGRCIYPGVSPNAGSYPIAEIIMSDTAVGKKEQIATIPLTNPVTDMVDRGDGNSTPSITTTPHRGVSVFFLEYGGYTAYLYSPEDKLIATLSKETTWLNIHTSDNISVCKLGSDKYLRSCIHSFRG